MYKQKPKIVIFNQDTLEHIGFITRYTTLVWEPKYKGIGEFEFWCELCDENIKLIKSQRIIWIGGEECGIIFGFEESIDDKGIKKLDVKGLTLNEYLKRRIIWGTYIAKNKKTSQIMKDLVNENFISPADEKRKFNFMKVQDMQEFGDSINYQKTGGFVEEELESLCEASSSTLGFKLYLDVKKKELNFKVLCGTDRSIGNAEGNKPVLLSTDLKDILSSEYKYDCRDEKNVALVAGEGEGEERKKVISGDNSQSGLYRRELYVDARDLKSSDGNGNVFTDEVYESMLNERGLAKLGEYITEENFSTKVRVTGYTNYEFGVDYFLGDTVTIEDKILGIKINATIYDIKEVWDSKGYELNVTFGYSRLRVSKKIKRIISSV